MPLGKRLSLLALVLILAAIVVICLTPVMVADGLRLFALWKGREQGVNISLGQIESPLFRPVVIHRIRITSMQPNEPLRVRFEATRAELDLNLRALFFRSAGRIIHRLAIDDLDGNVERVPGSAPGTRFFDWRCFHHLLADDLRLTNCNLRWHNGALDCDLRGIDLNANEIEAGRFRARAIHLSTPWFRRQFMNLRGATTWENDRFTVGALSLARGLDVETITIDLSLVEKKRVESELNLDAFGGHLRASIASDSREKGVLWNVAGTAAEISLAQMSAALGLADAAGGSVHASKFTFRGDLQNLSHATASVWTEVTGFSWRDRAAETIMLGASLYQRQIDVTQFFVKQRNNQFTLTGEYALPAQSSDWVSPDFRADISASINNLGDFARLFGAAPNDFSGSLSIAGIVNGRDRNIGGHLSVNGTSLLLFKTPADVFSAQMSLKGSQLIVNKLEARHGQNLVQASGQADLARQHNYSGVLKATMANIADYWPLLPARWQTFRPDGDLTIDWKGRGDATAHSGDFRIEAKNIRTTSRLGLLPFDAHLDGTYSPQNIFFRDFRLSNPHADFSAFVTIATDYLQLQTLTFDLDGQTKLQGSFFLPVALASWVRGGGAFLGAVDPSLNFDVDLRLEAVDLAQLAVAFTGLTSRTGSLRARLETYGPLPSLQAKFEAHLRDFSDGATHRAFADLQAEIAHRALTLNFTALPAGSSPIKLNAILPLRLDGNGPAPENIFARDLPISATLDFPAILLAKLPRAMGGGIFREGILSGKLVAAQSLRRPQIAGDAQIVNGRLNKAPGPLAGLSGRLNFEGSSASLEFASLDFGDGQLHFHGAADFADTSRIGARLVPEAPLPSLTNLKKNDCIGGLNFFPVQADKPFTPKIREIDLQGDATRDAWRVTFDIVRAPGLFTPNLIATETFALCAGHGAVLQLGVSSTERPEPFRSVLPAFQGKNRLSQPGMRP